MARDTTDVKARAEQKYEREEFNVDTGAEADAMSIAFCALITDGGGGEATFSFF